MIRDWKLMGEIFTAIEEERFEEMADEKRNHSNTMNDHVFLDFMRHVEMLLDAGYLKGIEIGFSGKQYYFTIDNPRITLSGYDFADTVKDKKLLNKTLDLIEKSGLVATFETIKYFTPISIKFFAECIRAHMQ